MKGRHKIRPAALLLLLWGFVPTGAASAAPGAADWTLALRDSVRLPAGEIRLADIVAEPVPPAAGRLLVASGAKPGAAFEIDRRRVLRLLSSGGLADGVRCLGPEVCLLTVGGVRLNGAVVEARLQALLAEWLPEADAEAPPTWLEWDLTLPGTAVGPDWKLELADPKPLQPGRNLVPLQLRDGERILRWSCSVMCHAYGEVAQLRKAVPRGTPLRDDCLSWQWQDLCRTEPNLAVGRPAAVAKEASRDLQAGQILRQADLKERALIRRGEAVELKLRRGQVSVTVPATARQDGCRGQIVSVRNELDGRVIIARVTGPGVVEYGR